MHWTFSRFASFFSNPPFSFAESAASAFSACTIHLPDHFIILTHVIFGMLASLLSLYLPSSDLQPPNNLMLSPSVQSNILRICECGWLHNRIRRFVDGVRDDKTSGKLMLALALAIEEQLSEYYRLVATLEAHLNRDQGVAGPQEDPILESGDTLRAPPSSSFGAPLSMSAFNSQLITSNGDNSQQQLLRQPLTLTRLILWLQEPKRRLKLMAALCDACQGKKGGALATQVYTFAEHGYTSLRAVMRHLLVNVTRALHEMIAAWIYDGKLSDPNHEFFVAVNPSISNERLWYDKYSIRKSMLPRFISMEQAKRVGTPRAPAHTNFYFVDTFFNSILQEGHFSKSGKISCARSPLIFQILLIGKSVNFLMHVCGESQNLKELEPIKNTRLKEIESIFAQEFSQSFDLMISTAYKHTSKRLLEILLSQYHFMEHLKACRQFLLLGQGDFVQRLMDLLQTELDAPATGIHRHHLSEILESAIRGTNAQYEAPEILQRLDVQLLELSENEEGWDVFSLDYIVDGPLSTIFTPDCRLSYLRSFNFLWRAKRMESTLNQLWREQLVLARLPYGLSEDLTPVLHVVQLLGAEIRHFVQQLQYYVSFEALECAWGALVKNIHQANDLDDVIEAHQHFLSSVISRCLLDADSRQLICQLRAIFDLIINFSQLHGHLEDTAAEECDYRARLQLEVSLL
ncbi:unnamed protein product [Schistocephalus solidus]|uniref:Gamma-tubulin complex component n=1 Tax=Schistocephalus solidus TaxID=70667 RepID=A0A183SZ72_SCHSO|nr:unnamed protein product [Schistocephalus solidus]